MTMQAFLSALSDDYLFTVPIFGDWLEENGYFRDEAIGAVVVRPMDFSGSGSGSGIGRGSGSGIGRGIGSGSGSGIGRGIGRGSGSGSGSGIGRGIGIGIHQSEVLIMEIGKAYLIHAGDWHTFVGRVVRQIGPFTYQMEKVSKIRETNNGDCWNRLAAGDKSLRKAAEYEHYTTPTFIPLTIAAFEWVGKLPQEEKQ